MGNGDKAAANQDRSKPLSISLTEEQWLLVGGLLADEIEKPTLPKRLRPSIRAAALKIQQTINKLWRSELSLSLQGVVVNIAGGKWGNLSSDYCYGPED